MELASLPVQVDLRNVAPALGYGADQRNRRMSSVEELKSRNTVLAEERTDLALQRTIIAQERTLMAWIRTSLSMIGFGFSIYKFFQYLPEEIASGNVRRPQAPRNLGMTLIALGTLALAAATWQHLNSLKHIGAFRTRHLWSISSVVAIAVILIGCITFYGVLLRHGPF